MDGSLRIVVALAWTTVVGTALAREVAGDTAAPHSVPVREVRLSAGAGFIVVICGEIMTMPGLPRKPAAQSIRFNDEGLIEGLF